MNNIGTMIGVNGGPVPEDTSTSNSTNTLNMGPNGYLNKVNSGNGGKWYPEKEEVIPRVYHKYYKGCKHKDDNKDDDTKDPSKDPENPPENPPTPPDPEQGDDGEKEEEGDNSIGGSFIMDSEE